MNSKVKSGIIICIAIVIGLAVYFIYSANKSNPAFVAEVNRNLTPDQEKIYNDRLAEANNKLNEDLSNEDRQKWLLQKGIQLSGLGKLSEAQEVFEDAKKLNKAELLSYTLLYQVYLESGDNDKALTNIKEAIEIKPESADVWKKYILLMMERFHAGNDQINLLYSEAVVKTNNHIDILSSYASWLEKSGNYLASKEYWQKAIELNPTNKKVYEAEIKRLDELMSQQQ